MEMFICEIETYILGLVNIAVNHHSHGKWQTIQFLISILSNILKNGLIPQIFISYIAYVFPNFLFLISTN